MAVDRSAGSRRGRVSPAGGARAAGPVSPGSARTARRARTTAARSRGDATRFQLDDRVLRVRDPRVIHAQQLLYECVPDALEVAQGQVALVELAVAGSLVDDARD